MPAISDNMSSISIGYILKSSGEKLITFLQNNCFSIPAA